MIMVEESILSSSSYEDPTSIQLDQSSEEANRRHPRLEGEVPTRCSHNRANRSFSSCWMSLTTTAMAVSLLLLLVVVGMVSADTTTEVSSSQQQPVLETIPFLQTKPPHHDHTSTPLTRTSASSTTRGKNWNELLLLKKYKDLMKKNKNKNDLPVQPQHPRQPKTTTAAATTTTGSAGGKPSSLLLKQVEQQQQQQQQTQRRGNVRRRTRSYRGKEINRALRRKQHNHQYRTAPHHRDGHNTAMAEKEDADEEEEITDAAAAEDMDFFPMGEEATTMPGMGGEGGGMMMMEQEQEGEDQMEEMADAHGDGLDHHHHKHNHDKHHHKQQKHQHMHEEPEHHPGQARRPKGSKKSKGVKYQDDLSYTTPTTSDAPPTAGTTPEGDEEYETDYGDYYYKTKGKSKRSKRGYAVYEEENLYDESNPYQSIEYNQYHYGKKSKTKSKASSSKSAHRGKKGKRQHYGGGSAGQDYGELRYFEASVLMEMQDHYVMELSYLDLQQLETAVMETYNHLSEFNCDSHARELVAVTMDPTPTSTGYILHMQGQCYGCDDGQVEVFAHDGDVFDQEMMTPMKPDRPTTTRPPEGVDGEFTPPPTEDVMMMTDAFGNGTDAPGGAGTTPGTDPAANGTMMAGGGTDAGAGAGAGAGAADANATTMGMETTAPAPGNRTVSSEKGGRNRGGSATGILSSSNYGSYGNSGFSGFMTNQGGAFASNNGLMSFPGTSNVYSSSEQTGSEQVSSTAHLLPKKRKTFSKQRSRLVQSEDDAPKDLEDALPDFDYGTTAESRAAYHHNEQLRRKLQHHHHRHHHHKHQHMHEADSVEEEAAINRGPETATNGYAEEVLQEDDRHMHLAGRDSDGSLVTPYRYSKSKKSKTQRKGSKKSKGSSSDGPDRYCTNPEPTRDAPTEKQFVLALNKVTDELLAQYNKLSVRSAVQVKPEPCSATEEEFDSSMVMLFMGPVGSQETPQSLKPAEMKIVEQTIMHSFNHLQATHSCDVPYFREMTEVTLRGTAPGPMPDSFLVMFDIKGTCRGEGCSDGATFFDPRDDDDEDEDEGTRTRRRRHNRGLTGHIRMPQGGFSTVTTRSGHTVASSEGDYHVYHEQCYCPFKVDEFGPPFVSDMQEVLDSILRDASASGMIDAVVSVEDIMEVSDSWDDDVAYDEDKSRPDGKEDVDSFIIIQFFGQRDAVTKEEVDEISMSIPIIYKNLQDTRQCDDKMRVIESAELMTVDPGPTPDSFLLGFALSGECHGNGCSKPPMLFAIPGQAFVNCGDGTGKLKGPPIIEDFENDLYNAILELQGTGDLMYITISGDAVEVLPGATPAPIFSSGNVPAPAPKFGGRTAGYATGRTAANPGAANKPTVSSSSSEDATAPSAHPTYWPTWLDTEYPTYRHRGMWGG